MVSLVNAEGADWRGVAATHRPPEFDDMYHVPQSSVGFQSTSAHTFPIIFFARPLTSNQDDHDVRKQPLTSAQTGKHPRNERPDYENGARKRKKSTK